MDTTYTEELNLVLLLKRALVWWRLFLCAGLIGAVLLGSVGYVKKSRDLAEAAAEAAKQAADKSESVVMEEPEVELLPNTEEELRAMLTKLQINQVQYFVSLAQTLQINENYRATSPLMQLDPHHKQTLVVQYVIDGNDSLAPLLTDIYYSQMLSKDVWEQIDAALGYEPESDYLAELLSMGITRSDTSGVLTIYLHLTKGVSQETASAALTGVMDAEYQALLAQGFFHSLHLAEINVRTSYDRDLENRQTNLNSTIKSQTDALINGQNNMTNVQKALFALYIESGNGSYLNFNPDDNRIIGDTAKADEKKAAEAKAAEEEEPAPPATVSLRDLIKYAAVGFILGVFLAALWLLWREMFFSGDSVETVPVLGRLRDGRARTVFEKIFFSQLVYRLVYGSPNVADQTRSMAAMLVNLCAGRDLKELTLVGADELSETAKPIWEEMRNALASSGVKVTEAALADAPGTGAQVLVLATGKTPVKTVRQLMERTAVVAGKVYGAIMLEV